MILIKNAECLSVPEVNNLGVLCPVETTDRHGEVGIYVEPLLKHYCVFSTCTVNSLIGSSMTEPHICSIGEMSACLPLRSVLKVYYF
jgi:hypothetical protein